MIPQRVSLLTIGCLDLPVLREFYARLGWEETDHGFENYAIFKTAGVMLSLFPLEDLAKDSGVEIHKSPNLFSGVAFAVNVDQPEQVDAAIEQVRQSGGKIVREPSDAFWGGRTAYFADPENNLWEIAWNPDSVFDERGAMLTL